MGFYGENTSNKVLKSKIGKLVVDPNIGLDRNYCMIKCQYTIGEVKAATKMLDERKNLNYNIGSDQWQTQN